MGLQPVGEQSDFKLQCESYKILDMITYFPLPLPFSAHLPTHTHPGCLSIEVVLSVWENDCRILK